MKKNILYLIVILGVCQGIFAMDLQQQIEDFRRRVNEAKRFATLGNFEKAWQIFQEPHELYTLNYGIWKRMNEDLRNYIVAAAKRQGPLLNEFWTLEQEVRQLINQGKFEEAQNKYNKLKALYNNIKQGIGTRTSTELYDNAIADLEKSISEG